MTLSRLYPLTFSPVFRDYIWGGRNLETLYGRNLPPGIIAESWEISAHSSGSTPVEAGLLAGQKLSDVFADWGWSLVGSNPAWALERNRFPLLIKLLDAQQDLSVQVHPPDSYALRHNSDLGKTEMWYVLHAAPGAQLIYGLNKGATPARLQQALKTHNLESLLHYLPIKAGDTIFLKTGTVHALLAGAVVAEVQQNSDTTYRLYDWGRLGADGQPRPLHIQRALEVIDFDIIEPQTARPHVIEESPGRQREELINCPYFVVERLHMAAGAEFLGKTSGQSMEIFGVVDGECTLFTPESPAIILPRIKFILLPAVLGDYRMRALQDSVLLRIYLPKN